MYLRTTLKIKGSTNACYVSVIARVRDQATGTKLSVIPEIHKMIKGFKMEDQIQRFRPPKWDLSLVLRSLTKAPYEPIEKASMEALTRKTVFLLGFATAARVSEIHALDIDLVRFKRDNSSVNLGLLMSFIAKNQMPNQQPRSYSVQSLSQIVGPEDVEDLALCPVRALHHYVDKTRRHRHGRSRLFISCNPNHIRDITKNTVSMWIRSTILQAYRKEHLPAPAASNPHELRALAATMSLHCNTSLQHILSGCYWATDSVFATYYLRDVSTEDVEGFHHLGPVVAAQTLVNSSRPRHK